MSNLIGTKYNPEGFNAVRALSRRAKAYHTLSPYPAFSPMTTKWKSEDRGPLPRCQPFVRWIIEQGAAWLFKNPITFVTDKGKTLDRLLNDVWTGSNMSRRGIALARQGALCGQVALKWSYDEEEGPKIHMLDASEQTRFYWNCDDSEILDMVRVQYPKYDALTGVYSWYREDWSDETHVVYKPLPAMSISGQVVNDPYQLADKADASGQWEIQSKTDNPFGIIPFWLIRNSETGTTYGEGDLWAVYEIIDQINFNIDLGHKHNQDSVKPTRRYIDLTTETGDAPGLDSPGSREILVTQEDAKSQGTVDVERSDSGIRPHLREFYNDLLHQVYNLVGAVDIDTAEITNKGNLTAAVQAFLYGPLIAMTNLKRQCYGEDGIAVFMERLSAGMAYHGVKGFKAGANVEVIWPEHIPLSETEKTDAANRQILLLEKGLTTKEAAARKIAGMDGIIDIDDLLRSLSEDEAISAPGADEKPEDDNEKTSNSNND